MATATLPQVLIVDDDALFQQAVRHTLKGRAECRTAYHSDEALVLIKKNRFDVAFLDISMRTPEEGLQAIPRLLELDPELPVVMSSGRSDFETVREAMRLGAWDYVPKDFDPEELRLSVERAIQMRALKKRNQQHDREASHHHEEFSLVGESPAINRLRTVVEKVLPSSADVLITGETGTGKEVVARQFRRRLADGTLEPFVALDCSTLALGTAESILFGHEKGSFTGATQNRAGLFEEADGGILFLDEIANLPLEIQPKLLRAIQEREVRRLGSDRTVAVRIRIIAATNRSLEKEVAEGRFKEDLYQRLNVIPIETPPLRDRTGDIPELARLFLGRMGERARHLTLSTDATVALQYYSWPGNVRELQNVIAYVATLAAGPEIEISDLPPRIRGKGGENHSGSAFYEKVAEFERALLSEEYRLESGNISRLAMKLGMDRSHLHVKLKEHGIHHPKKRP